MLSPWTSGHAPAHGPHATAAGTMVVSWSRPRSERIGKQVEPPASGATEPDRPGGPHRPHDDIGVGPSKRVAPGWRRTDESGSEMSSSDLRSASTPKNQAMIPPASMTIAPK